MSLRRTALLGFVVPLVTLCSGWVARPDPINSAQPGTAGWLRETAVATRLPDPATASPDTVARGLAAVPDADRATLITRYPAVVGNLDGAPLEMRFAANERRVRAAGLHWPGGRTLAYDPRGRGTVVEVLGDLATADRIAVVVPGNDVDLSHLDGPGQLRDLAYGLRAAIAESGSNVRVAVVAWAGYRTPGGLGMDALRADLARAGADRLVRFLSAMRVYRPGAPVSLFCHSYGSVVCGFAAPRIRVADIVAFGSPGLHARSIEALRTSARMWVALARNDWVGTVAHVELLGLGHGPSPASAAFGARVVDTGGAQGHLGYLAPGTRSRRNLARIAVGDYPAVTSPDGRRYGDGSR